MIHRLDATELNHLCLLAPEGSRNANLIASAVAEIRRYRAAISQLSIHASIQPPGFGATKKAIEMCISLLEGSS